MLKALTQRPNRPEAPPWPHIDIIFLDASEGKRYGVNTFMQVPMLPRVGETITLDGDFRRRGTFIVERVEHNWFAKL